MRAFGVIFKQWWNFVVLIAFGSSNACKADQMSRSVKCESSLCKQLLSELSRPIVFLTGKVDKRSNSSTLNCKSNSAILYCCLNRKFVFQNFWKKQLCSTIQLWTSGRRARLHFHWEVHFACWIFWTAALSSVFRFSIFSFRLFANRFESSHF